MKTVSVDEAYQRLIARALIFVAGQLAILNAPSLVENRQEDDVQDQLQQLIADWKALQ